MHRHLKEDLVPPDHLNSSLSAGFSQVIEMMMAKDVSQRYQNAADLIEDLDAVASGRSPQYAQPTLDFAKLAEVAKATSSDAPMQQSKAKTGGSDFSSMLLPMLIGSGVLNIILLVLWLLSLK
jgi:serine/threonine-protein kinase